MEAQLHVITECPVGRLAIMARPRADDWLTDEIASWRRQGLNTIVSMLENDEIEELRLGDEAVLCENAGMRFIHFPVGDRGTPASIAAVSKLVSGLATELRGGRAVGIYCRMGIGRSASLAVCVLAALGMVLEDAWAAMERARHLSVPDTLAQKEWVAAWCATFDFPRPDA